MIYQNLNYSVSPKVNDLREGIVIGNRIPQDYFVTKGIGQSDIAIHAGSYHLALRSAGIEMCNIMTYSSILPGIAKKIERPEHLTHGSVMECILSVSTAKKGNIATAGVIYGWLYNKKSHERYGGLVCEHQGNYPVSEIKGLLRASLDELYFNGFSDEYELSDIELMTESFKTEKKFGTALVGLCFVNYLVPVIHRNLN